MMLVGGLTALATSTAAALAVAGFYRAARALGASSRRAIGLSLLLGGATVLWPYGTVLYSEAFVAALLAWTAALLLEARVGSSPASSRNRIVAAALLLGLSLLTKIAAIAFIPAILAAVLADSRTAWPERGRVTTVLALGAGLAVAVYLAWNAQRFGNPFEVGYDWSETIPVMPARAFDLVELPRGLAVLLFSPGKSLFLWAPPLLLAIGGLLAAFRSEPGIAVGVSVATVSALVFYGSYIFPEGGYAHGPRHLVPLVPLALLPAALPAVRLPSRAAIAACAGAGVVMALLAVSVSYLEDQALGGDTGNARGNYFERISPAPGRPWNRYRLDYLPFVRALSTPGWLSPSQIGNGPDYFPLHVAQARRTLPGGAAIPSWLPLALPVPWLLLLLAGGVGLARAARVDRGQERDY